MVKLKKSIIVASSIVLSRHSAEVVFLMEMCSAFAKNGLETTLLVPNFFMARNDLFEYYGVEYPFKIKKLYLPKILTKGKLNGRGFIFSLFAARFISKMNYDIIYSRTPWVFFNLCIFYRKPCCIELHQFRFKSIFQSALYRLIIKYGMSNHKSSMICISRSLKKQWADFGVDKSRIIPEHDAVNLSKFTGNISKTKAKRLIGIKENKKIVAYTGSLQTGKGVHILIQCANLLPEIIFLIVGGEKNEIERLKRYMKHSNILFTGRVKPTLVPIYQASADILVLPNTKGSSIDDVTSPMKLFEYMATKRPIIATDMPSLLEILENERNALICRSGDYFKLSEKIKQLIDNNSLSMELSNKAYNDLEKYTWDARTQRLIKWFSITFE
jgi:glycosyltransferase involved in cell wall biosynthesis